jgi:hypothetical protein
LDLVCPVCPEASWADDHSWVTVRRFGGDQGLDALSKSQFVSKDDSPLKKNRRDSARLVRPKGQSSR